MRKEEVTACVPEQLRTVIWHFKILKTYGGNNSFDKAVYGMIVKWRQHQSEGQFYSLYLVTGKEEMVTSNS